MKKIKLAIIAGALSSVAAVAVAQTGTPPAPPAAPEAIDAGKGMPRHKARFERMDANKDGAIDQQEFATRQNLKDADANGDGTLSREELVTMIQKRQADRLTRRLDINGDGNVTLAEIEKQRSERFALLDRNDDGKLEAHELRGKHGGKGKFHRHGDRRGGPDRGGADDMDL